MKCSICENKVYIKKLGRVGYPQQNKSPQGIHQGVKKMGKQKTSSEEQLERVHTEASRLLDLMDTTTVDHYCQWDDDTSRRFDNLRYALTRFQGGK